jgi:tetratricopeptide (TPR) repeat protein
MGKMKFTWLALAIIIVAGSVFYSNSFNASFQFDDANVIVLNEKISDMRNYADRNFWSNINIRPLSYSSFAMNYAMHGESVWGYHLVNLLIHLINGFLVFILARFMISLAGAKRFSDQSANLVALFIALLFLLHPLQTMGVTYIVQRMTSMAAMFYLLAVLLYGKGRLAYIENKSKRKPYLLLAASVVSGVLGVLSKQTAITFPLAFLFFELYFIRSKEGTYFKKYLLSGFSAIILAFLVVTALGYLPRETESIGRGDYLVTQFKVFLNYLQLLFVPVGQNVDHGISVSRSLMGYKEIIGMLIFIGLLVIAYFSFSKHKLISFGIIWFFLTISIESSLFPIRDVMMEHRLYLPMFGFSLALLTSIYLLCGVKRMKYCSYGLSVLIIVLGILTYQRNRVWESDYTLWKDSIQRNPENPRAMVNYGFALVKKDLYNEAIRYYTRALEKDNSLTKAYFNRGIAYFDKRQYEKSIQDMTSVLEDERMVDAIPYFFRGTAYAHLRMPDQALADLSRSIELNPNVSESFKNRGLVYEMRQEYERALVDYDIAFQLNPANRKLLINRSKIYYLLKDYQKALDDILWAERAGLEIDNDYVKMLQVRVANPQDTTSNYVIRRKE